MLWVGYIARTVFAVRRTVAVVGLYGLALGCGSSEPERVARGGPNYERPEPSSCYDEAQSRVALGSSNGEEIPAAMRRQLERLLEASESDRGSVLCASNVDRAPAIDPAAAEIAQAWVDAINRRDWPEVCRLSVPIPGQDCEELVEAAFDKAAGEVAIEGFYVADRRAAAALSGADVEAAVEPAGEGFLVHIEVAIIR